MNGLTRKIATGISTFAIGSSLLVTSAFAATTYSLFADAQIVTGGNPGNAAQLRSAEPGGFGGVGFATDTVSTLSDLQNLATDYKFVENSCGGGSPRFQVRVTSPDNSDTGNIFVYIGPPPSYTGCPMNVWTNTGNLVTPASLVDTSQLDAGTFYDPYSAALVKYGNYTVNGISQVADGEWAFVGNQTVLVDNVQINTDVVTFEDKNSCKKGGWQNLQDDQGNNFANQGDCVSYYSTGGKNKAN